MRKLFSALAVVLVFAMAFTITASAAITGTEVYQPVSGKYTITAQDDDIKGAMVGMVVIEAAQDPETFTIDEDDIRYIDQVTADAAGNITIPAFTPMAKTVDTNKYLVYVGGGILEKATKVGELNVPIAPTGVEITGVDTLEIGKDAPFTAAIAPTGATGTLSWDSDNKAVATVDNTGKVTAIAKGTANITVTVVGTTPAITDTWAVEVIPPAATGVTLDKETAEVALGKTLTLKATIAPEKAEGTLSWDSTDKTKATVVDGVVTPVAVGTTTITVSIEGTSFSDSCEVKVVEESTVLYGDVDGNGEIKNKDLSTLARYMAEWPDYPISVINVANADVTADGEIKNGDLSALARHLAEWPAYLTLPYVK